MVHSFLIAGPRSLHCCEEPFLAAKLPWAMAASASVHSVEAGVKASMEVARANKTVSMSREAHGSSMVWRCRCDVSCCKPDRTGPGKRWTSGL